MTPSQPTYVETLAYVQQLFRGVTDHGGVPYWTHCERVAQRLTDPEERLAGLLHDVIEDTEVTAADLLARGYSRHVVEIVELVSRDKSNGLTYIQWVESIVATGNRAAMRVKLADNEDNSDPVRIANLPPEKRSIKRRYERSKRILRAALEKKLN